MTAAAAVSFQAPAADALAGSMDVYPDGVIDSFDVAMARKKGLPAVEIANIQNYVLGREYIIDQPTADIDESCILEPKGAVHTGEGTFYGGGYEGGCAMLDPVSRDYWIVAMNLADYNDAQLAGAYLEVTGELGTINMLVTDLLPEGKRAILICMLMHFPL